MTTVVSWLWKNSNTWRQGYTAEHVNRLYNMLKRHTTVPFDFVCVTDSPEGIKTDTYPLWDKPDIKTAPNRPNCYKRLFMFSDEAKGLFGDRILSIDIDVIIQGNVDFLLTEEADFRAMKGTCSPYNGSVWSLKTGSHLEVWEDFHEGSPEEVLKNSRDKNGRVYYGSDQAWMSYKIKGAPTWDFRDGIYQFHSDWKDWNVPPEDMKVLFAAGEMKPWDKKMMNKHPNIFLSYYRESS